MQNGVYKASVTWCQVGKGTQAIVLGDDRVHYIAMFASLSSAAVGSCVNELIVVQIDAARALRIKGLEHGR